MAAILAFPSTPSQSSLVEAAPPDRQQLQLVEELAQWVDDGSAFQAVAERPVATVIRDRRRSFELFRLFHGATPPGELLAGVPYGAAIARAAERQQLDPFLVAAIVEVESGFRPAAVSPVGAVGLMQVMPQTFADLGGGDAADPATNLRLGCRYLRQLLDLYGGDLELALAAYNAGPGNVARFGGVPPFSETRRYVERVLARYVSHHRDAWRGSEVAELLGTVVRGRRGTTALAALPPAGASATGLAAR
jgi:soluble lytic murein transglycosylase-like protein